MFKRIEEYDRFVSILGFKNKVIDVDQFVEKVRGAAKPASVQVFDADRVAGFEHLFFAALNALRSFSQKKNIAGTIDLEILLYASGQRQIRKAFEMVGVKSGTSKVAVLILADDKSKVQDAEESVSRLIDGVRDDRVLEERRQEKIRRLMELKSLSYGKKADYETVTKLIIERGALLVTRR